MQTVSRLIDQFIPEHYQLSLAIERNTRTFSGIITMTGNSTETASTVSVHTKDLTIESVTFDGKEAEYSQGNNDELTITHPDITTGKHIITLAFHGIITDAMHGMYPCYFEHDGVKKELIATQFESHHAREVFPCIDEPAAKATFDVTLTTEPSVTVLGNMPIKSQNVENEKLVTHFETTPRMSTYLLAWVTGEFQRKTASSKSGVEVNIWATPAQPAESLDFALNMATRIIDFFDEYFDTPYPLPKSDHVALPDFSSGAMENWGLITYREIALLADPKTTSISSKHYIATVIAHELSHQWFGNLVTMKWWNNLWLNESFATLMEYIAVDALQPDWNVWLDFATMESIMSLRRDSIDGVQAVQIDVHHPDEISTLFDGAIVYAKGARLLRMLQQYVGNEAFQTGLKTYFSKYAYKNTEGDDLWQEIGSASGKDIAHFMNTWISQPGYPVLNAINNGDSLYITQKQFFVGPHRPSDTLWPIPLNASSSIVPEIMDTPELTISGVTDSTTRFNVGDSAHFITHYDTTWLKHLVSTVQTGNMSSIDRLQLLHEQTLLARGGEASTAEIIPLLAAYRMENTEPVWDIISLAVGELKKFVEADENSEKKLRNFAANLARDQYTRLGWIQQKDESETDTKLRATIIGMMLYGEDSDALRTAITLYDDNSLNDLNPELRSLIIGAAVRHGDDDRIIDALIDTYKKTSSAELKQDIASGLTSSKNPLTLARLLALILDETTIRHQDTARWFVWIMRNRYGRDIAWQWLQGNWPWVKKTFGGDKSYDDFPRYAAATLVTRKQLEQYQTFFSPMLNEPALSRVISMGVSEIEGRVALIERDGKAVRDVLEKL